MDDDQVSYITVLYMQNSRMYWIRSVTNRAVCLANLVGSREGAPFAGTLIIVLDD